MSTSGRRADEVRFSVRGPLFGQGEAAERILRALPGWFGIEAALQDYVRAADELETSSSSSPGPPAVAASSGPTRCSAS